jgi:hypothetical protein
MPRLKIAGNTRKKKKCNPSRSFPCGYSCQAIGRNCKNRLKGQAQTSQEWLELTAKRLEKVKGYLEKRKSRVVGSAAMDKRKRGSAKKGLRYLQDTTTNDFARTHKGVIAIADAIDNNNGIVDTGLLDNGKRGFTPGSAVKYGKIKVLRLNKPSKSNPYGTATVIHPSDGSERIFHLIQLADGVRDEINRKTANKQGSLRALTSQFSEKRTCLIISFSGIKPAKLKVPC